MFALHKPFTLNVFLKTLKNQFPMSFAETLHVHK